MSPVAEPEVVERGRVEEAAERAGRLVANVEQVVHGKDEEVRRVASALAAAGDVLFANVVLVDEVNRAMPRTQSALLEAMAERQVTVEGATRPLPDPFVVLATENPIEQEGTFPLPEAQLDRFVVRTGLGYPPLDDEV